MKILKNYISYRLEILFNCSFTTGTVPDHFKMAKVILVYKKASSLMVSNYRPISLLSIFNKILERLMYNRLIKYFEKSCTFFDQQFGFRSNHSTVHALILIHRIHNGGRLGEASVREHENKAREDTKQVCETKQIFTGERVV